MLKITQMHPKTVVSSTFTTPSLQKKDIITETVIITQTYPIPKLKSKVNNPELLCCHDTMGSEIRTARSVEFTSTCRSPGDGWPSAWWKIEVEQVMNF